MRIRNPGGFRSMTKKQTISLDGETARLIAGRAKPPIRPEIIKALLEFSKTYGRRFDPLLLISDERTPLSSAAVKSHWEQLVSEQAGGPEPGKYDFYVHIPFCRKKCSYCIYYSAPPAGQQDADSEIAAYLDYLSRTIRFFAPAFSPATFRCLYIGGGTPSLLSADRIDRLLGELFGNFNFAEKGEKSFECNPESITREKLLILKKYGMNRISMGVQTYSRTALSHANRAYQKKTAVQKTSEMIKSLGFVLNLDLIAGLHGDTPESFLDTFLKIAALRPDTIVMYALTPTPGYIRRYFSGDIDTFWRDFPERTALFTKNILQAAATEGYRYKEPGKIGAPIVFVNEKTESPESVISDKYSDVANPPASLFGIGPASRSHIYKHLVYTARKENRFEFNPDDEIYDGRVLNVRQEMLRYVILSLRSGRKIDTVAFSQIFKEKISDAYPSSLKSLLKSGKLRDDNGMLHIPTKSDADTLFCSVIFAGETEI